MLNGTLKSGLLICGLLLFSATAIFAAQWEPMSNINAPIFSFGWPSSYPEMMSAVVDSKLVVIGKRGDSGRFSSGIYDLKTNSWEKSRDAIISDMPEVFFESARIFANDRFYVWGGCISKWCETRSNMGWMIDPTTNTWTRMSDEGSPTPRRSPQVLAADGKLIVWFGATANYRTIAPDVGVFDPANSTWSSISLEGGPTPRLGAALWYNSGNLYVVGGHAYDSSGRNQVFSDAFIYNLNSKSWKKIPGMETTGLKPRYDAVVMGMGEKVLIWGGKTKANQEGYYHAVSDSLIFDSKSETWSSLKPSESEGGPNSHEGAIGLWTGSSIVLWGGSSMNGTSTEFWNDGFSFEPTTGKWSHLPELDIQIPAIVANAGDQLLIWGDRWRNLAKGYQLTK